MNKSLIMSVSPRECELIASGRQTMLVRKTRPKIETPFKVYVYCTNQKIFGELIRCRSKELSKLFGYESVVGINKGYRKVEDDLLCGKVIGSFVCDEIIEDKRGENADVFSKFALLSLDEQKKYGANKPLYGWHISDLKIYDKPKELGEFRKPCNHINDCCTCKEAEFQSTAMNCAGLFAREKYRLPAPPQSWVYCEPIEEE